MASGAKLSLVNLIDYSYLGISETAGFFKYDQGGDAIAMLGDPTFFASSGVNGKALALWRWYAPSDPSFDPVISAPDIPWDWRWVWNDIHRLGGDGTDQTNYLPLNFEVGHTGSFNEVWAKWLKTNDTASTGDVWIWNSYYQGNPHHRLFAIIAEESDLFFGSDPTNPKFHNWISSIGGTGSNMTATPVPEPATLLLLGSGFACLVGFRRKVRKR